MCVCACLCCRNTCTGRLERRFAAQLTGSVQSFIDAARRVTTTACYVVLAAVATSLSLRVAAVVVLRRLAITATPRRDEQPTRCRDHDDVVDDASDDEAGDVICHCDDVTEHLDDAPPRPPGSTRPSGILHSLKFYETNV